MVSAAINKALVDYPEHIAQIAFTMVSAAIIIALLGYAEHFRTFNQIK